MRLIATILCKGDRVVQTYNYLRTRIIGTPSLTVKHLDLWQVDEIIVLQIDGHFESLIHNIESIATISTPITAGGGVTSLSQAAQLVKSGADRFCVQSMFYNDFEELVACSQRFGGQAITLKFDYQVFMIGFVIQA